MADCVYLSQDSVQINQESSSCCGSALDVRRCLSQDQPSDYCVPGKDFHDSLHGVVQVGGEQKRISAVACEQCLHKTIPVHLPPKDDEPMTLAKKMWMDIHYRGRLPVDGTRSAIVINCDTHGYGDAIVAAWLAEGNKESKIKIILAAHGHKKEFLEMLGQRVDVDAVPTISPTISQAFAYDIHTLRYAGRLATWSVAFGIDAKWGRPTVASDTNRNAKWKSVYGDQPLIVICPRSAHGSREWVMQYWTDLTLMLTENGFQVAAAGVDWIPTQLASVVGTDWKDIVSVMRMSKLVIGIDSAPMHMAGTLDVPAVCLLGPTTDGVFSHCKSITCMAPMRKDVQCVGCWMSGPQYKFDVCNVGCAALSNISPTDVFVQAMKLLT